MKSTKIHDNDYNRFLADLAISTKQFAASGQYSANSARWQAIVSSKPGPMRDRAAREFSRQTATATTTRSGDKTNEITA